MKTQKTLESACQTCHDVHNVVFASSFCQIIQLLRLELMTHKIIFCISVEVMDTVPLTVQTKQHQMAFSIQGRCKAVHTWHNGAMAGF